MRLVRTVLVAWLLAGTLDITTAILCYTGGNPARAATLLQRIASGLIGYWAFAGGSTTVVLGLALHYLIALIWTVVLLFGFAIAPALRRHLVLTGVGYGVVVWFVMDVIVLPLTHVSHPPTHGRPAAVAALILVLCIGLPLSLVLGRPLCES
jgi:hypothetical protein